MRRMRKRLLNTCIAIKPGAKKLIKGTPKTSSFVPIANDKTNKKSKQK